MTIKKNFRIIDVSDVGAETTLHPETNADQILAGVNNKVPTVTNINDWTNKSTEVIAARKGKASLVEKIDEIDLSKINKTDIVNDLTSGGEGKALSAEQGKVINTSLVDMTRHVKKIVVATQLEYDSLPGSKLTDNTLYIIKG